MDSLKLVDIELNTDHGYQVGVGVERNKEVFGLYLNALPTQMRYYVDDLLKKDDTVFDRATDSLKFYFDTGGNGKPIYCTIPELKRVMAELGLILNEEGEGNFLWFKRELRRVVTMFEEFYQHGLDSDDDYDDTTTPGDWWEQFVMFLSLDDAD